MESNDRNGVRVNSARLDMLERRMSEMESTIHDDMKEIKADFKESGKAMREAEIKTAQRLSDIEAQMAAIKTELRIAGLIMVVLLSAIIGVVIQHIISATP